jgi:uncharacterized membrane protein YdbT with pleckstrin-like domain
MKMGNMNVSAEDESLLRENMRGMGAGINSAASAAMVNRTHRVVQERAKNLQARRSRMRSLWIPLAVSGGMVAAIVMAIWTILEQDELIPTGLPDANQQLLVLMMWCLPVTVLLLAVVLYRRANAATDNGRAG